VKRQAQTVPSEQWAASTDHVEKKYVSAKLFRIGAWYVKTKSERKKKRLMLFLWGLLGILGGKWCAHHLKSTFGCAAAPTSISLCRASALNVASRAFIYI
jgi:hypothetical protein